MSEPILTIYNRHTPACGNPPALSNGSAELYVGDFANRHGDRWLFTFDRATRAAILRGGDADRGRAHAVHDGRVDGLVLAPEDTAWLPACWLAAAT